MCRDIKILYVRSYLQSNKSTMQHDMTNSTEKTKCLTTSNEPLRCKNLYVIQLEMKMRYLGIDMSYGDVEGKVRHG